MVAANRESHQPTRANRRDLDNPLKKSDIFGVKHHGILQGKSRSWVDALLKISYRRTELHRKGCGTYAE
jgi:hypothetical protein